MRALRSIGCAKFVQMPTATEAAADAATPSQPELVIGIDPVTIIVARGVNARAASRQPGISRTSAIYTSCNDIIYSSFFIRQKQQHSMK